MIQSDYLNRVYAGLLGKVIGVRHGGNVEGWTYEQLERTFGEITGYLHEFKNFAADDDTNGPVAFLRALEDYTHTREITPRQMGLTLLNYAPDNHGFFWWGGYGKSTEHTAYLNLKHGIMAPQSGSVEQNGAAVAEQIGGQIFIDVWGLIAPGNPELAAEYAEKMASVSHDGNGKYGGMFIAACVAQAFVESDLHRIIEAGLSVIPSDCEYARMARDVIAFHQKNPENWRQAFRYVKGNFGYDRYPGACHIIPNSAVIVLSLLYGEGNFSQTINIGNMCGWDTDCNVGNVGCIMAVRNGLEGIERCWREPINDFLCCSTVIGSMNIVDIPSWAVGVATLGYKIANESFPTELDFLTNGEGTRFHFELPGSTHGFRLDSDADWHVTAKVEHTSEVAASGSGSLKVFFDRAGNGHGHRVYYKTYYRPDDFNDSRYDPSFSPILYPGQTIEAKVKVPDFIHGVNARLYVKDDHTGERHYGPRVELSNHEWIHLTYDIPAMNGVLLSEMGVELIPQSGRVSNLVAFVDDFGMHGQPNYEVDFARERLEKWNGLHIEVSQLTYLRGLWTLESGELSGSYFGEPAEAYTGDLAWRDYHFEATVIPQLGEYHNISFRVQGGIRSYAVGFAPHGELALYKNDNGYTKLTSTALDWKVAQCYTIGVDAVGNEFKVQVNGVELLAFIDDDHPYLTGQVGFSNFNGSHTHYRTFHLNGISHV